MKIAELISKLDYHFNTLAGEVITDPDRARALRAVEVTEIVNDSRKITPDCLFFCIVGAVRDGHEFARIRQTSSHGRSGGSGRTEGSGPL